MEQQMVCHPALTGGFLALLPAMSIIADLLVSYTYTGNRETVYDVRRLLRHHCVIWVIWHGGCGASGALSCPREESTPHRVLAGTLPLVYGLVASGIPWPIADAVWVLNVVW